MAVTTPFSAAGLLAPLFEQHPQLTTLPNGLKVVCLPHPGQAVVSAQLWVRTGSIHEGAHCGAGLSHYLEHMLFQGSDNRAPGEIASAVQSLGGQLNAYTSFDRTVYFIDGPSESLGDITQLLYDLTLTATLPEELTRREREVILREIDMTADDPDRTLSRALFSTAYRLHPCRHPVIGHRNLFEQVSRDDLWQYYRRRYHPDNMVLVVVGDFDADALDGHLEANFASCPRRCEDPVNIQSEPEQLSQREHYQYGDFNVVRAALGFKIPSLQDSRAVGLDTMGSLLGGGYSSRLWQSLREEAGLVHEVHAGPWNPLDPGLFMITYQCDADKAAAAEAAIIRTLNELPSAPFTEAELIKAKRLAAISEIDSRQTVSGLASKLGLQAAIVGDMGYSQRYFDLLDKVSIESLNDLARETFHDHRLSRLALLPESARRKRTPARALTSMPDFKEKQLPNGARILWQHDPRLPRLHLRLATSGGALTDPTGKAGCASLLATLLTKDSKQHSASEIAEKLESEGTILRDACGTHTLQLSMDMSPELFTGNLELLEELTSEPGFRPRTFEREKSAQLSELREQLDEVVHWGFKAVRRRFFRDHPLGFGNHGDLQTVESIEPDDVRHFHASAMGACNRVVVLAGDCDPEKNLPLVERWLGALPAGEKWVNRLPFDGGIEAGEFTDHLPREQAVVFDAYLDPGIEGEWDATARIIDEILSDMSGPLFKAVREDQGLAYFVGATRVVSFQYGSFMLYAGTHPQQRQLVYDAFDQQVADLREGRIDPRHLEAARTRLKVQNRFTLQTASARALKAASNILAGREAMDWIHDEARLNAVSMDSVQQFARRFLDPEKRLRYCVTPK